MLGNEFIKQFFIEAKPHLMELVKEILEAKPDDGEVLSVDYDEAGRRIGTTYEGIRKMVRKGQLKAVKRGRRRGIPVSELRSYVQKNTK